ncbi:transforming growth factor beta regulator 1 [Arctopsyche grandis]|uniref:transforming growth factor beta regulator 1 n=1 Tax=Arctopsyche grandis TaxID=121162 RepID=UPI00406D8527
MSRQHRPARPLPPAYPDTPASNLKYKKKYAHLKNSIKTLIFENSALCDEVAQIQQNILVVKEERKFLLKKLLEYEDDPEPCLSYRNSASPTTSFSDNILPAKKLKGKSNSEVQDPIGKLLPINLSNLTVYSLGEIVDKPLYHTEEMIYPVGYIATRVYGSMRDPLKKCVYTCKITDGGNEPRFEIIAESDFESPIIGSSPNYCHSILLQYINDVADMINFSIFPNGARFFGLSHPTILNLIQNLVGAKKCTNYKKGRSEVPKLEEYEDGESDPTINFDKLQRCIMLSYHTIAEIKEEPPDDILHFSDRPEVTL